MASTLKINNLDTASGSTITIPTGKQLIITDGGGVRVPGTVLQVLNMRTDNGRSTTSTSLIDTGMTLTITPKATSSKILVFANFYEVYTGSTNTSAMFAINRGGTIIGDHQGATLFYSPASQYGNVQIQYYDEPNTTSATVYKMQYKSNNGNSVNINGDNTQNHFMLMEIAG